MEKEKKYNFVYKTTFFDGEYYIGKRSTNDLNDGYYGSGNRVKNKIKKYKRQGLKIDDICHREILEFADTENQAFELETKYLTETELNDPLCLNLCKGGLGGVGNNESWNKGLTKETDERMFIIAEQSRETQKGNPPPNKGKKGLQKAWNKGLTKETDERVKQYSKSISKATLGRTPWNKGKKGLQKAWNKGMTKQEMDEYRKNKNITQ